MRRSASFRFWDEAFAARPPESAAHPAHRLRPAGSAAGSMHIAPGSIRRSTLVTHPTDVVRTLLRAVAHEAGSPPSGDPRFRRCFESTVHSRCRRTGRNDSIMHFAGKEKIGAVCRNRH
jgi:hypothetical protein